MSFDVQEVELRVGETLVVGQHRVTVVEIDGEEIVFQVDEPDTGPPRKSSARPR